MARQNRDVTSTVRYVRKNVLEETKYPAPPTPERTERGETPECHQEGDPSVPSRCSAGSRGKSHWLPNREPEWEFAEWEEVPQLKNAEHDEEWREEKCPVEGQLRKKSVTLQVDEPTRNPVVESGETTERLGLEKQRKGAA